MAKFLSFCSVQTIYVNSSILLKVETYYFRNYFNVYRIYTNFMDLYLQIEKYLNK